MEDNWQPIFPPSMYYAYTLEDLWQQLQYLEVDPDFDMGTKVDELQNAVAYSYREVQTCIQLLKDAQDLRNEADKSYDESHFLHGATDTEAEQKINEAVRRLTNLLLEGGKHE